MTEPSTEIAVRQDSALTRHNVDREVTDSWVDVIKPIVTLSEHVASTDFVPKAYRDKPPAIAAAILHGRDLGLPPMTALALTDPIEGKPSIKAEGLRALVLAAGHDLQFPESTGVRCTMRGRRRGSSEWTSVTWTIDMAKAANLAGKDVWKKYPRAMLIARATAELCRMIFPDVLHGMGASEELLDDVEADAPAETPAPTATVSRARTRRTPPPAVPAVPTPTPEQSTRENGTQPVPAPAPADIPLPEPPGGAARVETPAPPAEDTQPDVVDAEPADDDPHRIEREIIHAASAGAPEYDQPAEVRPLRRPEDQPKVTAAQLRMLGATWNRLYVTKDEDRRQVTATLIGRELAGGTTKDMTMIEASNLIDRLGTLETPDDLDNLVRATLAERGGE